jgi:hypothetical protein
VKSRTVKSEQAEPPGQFGEVHPAGLVTLGINGERAGIYIELLGEIDQQRWRRHFIRLQHASRIAQAHLYQCEAELVGLPAVLRDKRQIFGSECRMAENFSLVRRKADYWLRVSLTARIRL